MLSLSTNIVESRPTVGNVANTLTHFAQSSKTGTVTEEFDAKLANRPFLVFDFLALMALNPERMQST